MKHLNGQNYVEVKVYRSLIQPTEVIIPEIRDEPKFLRALYQVQNITQIRKNQKLTRNNNDELVVENYP